MNLSLYYDTTQLGRKFEPELLEELRTMNRTLQTIELNFGQTQGSVG